MRYWNKNHAWRAGIPCIERDTCAADVIRYERNTYDNDLDIPSFLLEALEGIPARNILWVCQTKRHAQRYGEPYKVVLEKQAIILTTDTEEPLGYLVLLDPDLLDSSIKNR